MKKYLITFDLDTTKDNRTNDYNLISAIIDGIGTFCKPLSNTYLVATDSDDAKTIRDAIMKILSVNDLILVVEVSGVYASFNYNSVNAEIKNVLGK